MKKIVVLISALLLILLFAIPACAEAQKEPESEWTFMFYLCGSDLESVHGFASGNLQEISYCLSYDTIYNVRNGLPDEAPDIEDVNVVIETGGSREWHTQELGMNVRTDALQRWHFRPARNVFKNLLQTLEQTKAVDDEEKLLQRITTALHGDARMELKQELPLSSMASPETLSDFIRWSAENYPAKKYALVLWDHGMGAKNGLMIDELFNGDSMLLDELKTSLSDAGVHFEAVLFDACLMANLETACAIKDYADWMIASEELVAGKGTAMYNWLQQVYCTPRWDGRRLGRWICEMTQVKYAQENSEQSEDTLTWSVIDLKQIDHLASAFDNFFALCDDVYANAPDYMIAISELFNEAFEFGLGDSNMIDLARIPYHPYTVIGVKEDLYVDLLDALSDAVVFRVNGSSRSTAGGLSFCYADNLSPAELNNYAKVCPSSHYLALLDAINPNWDAPEWVHEKAKKLPEIEEIPDYQIRLEKGIGSDGAPSITILDGYSSLWNVHVSLSRLNPATGNVVLLGKSSADAKITQTEKGITYELLNLFTQWPTIEDVHCAAEMVSNDYMGGRLYNVPIMIGTEKYLLRCGLEVFGESAHIYGLWEGYDTDSGAFNRNVVPLSKVAGQEYTLLYPIKGTEGDDMRFESSEPMTMYRSLELSTKPLDPGTYYVDFMVEDIFKRHLSVGRAEMNWDGQKATLQGTPWQGEMTLKIEKQ